MLPTDQCLAADEAARLKLDLGLVVEHELPAGQRLAQVGFQRDQGQGLRCHLLGIEAKGVTALPFGAIHGRIGVAEST